MRASEFLTERKRKKKHSLRKYFYPGYHFYGYGGSSEGEGGGDGGGGESIYESPALELAKRLASRINLTKQTPGPAPVVPEASIGAISVSIHLFVCTHF